MNDYLAIDWKENPLEQDNEFLSAAVLASSYLTRFTNGDESFANEKVILPDPPKRGRPVLPKVPGHSYQLTNVSRASRLNRDEHQILIRALKIITSGRTNTSLHDNNDLEVYNALKPIITEENGLFLAFAEANWGRTFGRKPICIKPALKGYGTYRHSERVKCVKKRPAFYKSVDLVSYSYTEDEIPIEISHTANVVDVGKVAKFHPPTMMEPFFFKANTLPGIEENVTNSQLPVSEDRNIDSIVENHDVDLVVSLSVLKRLINFVEISEKWDIPVVIKEVKKSNGSVKKVIFLDKPFPKLQPTILDINEKCAKLFLRSNFCRIEGFTYPCEDIPLSNLNKSNTPNVVAEETNPEAEKTNDDTNESVASDNIDELFSEEEDETPSVKRKILHNAFYKLWKLKQKEEGNTMLKKQMVQRAFNILVRGKIDACEMNQTGTLQAVTVVPKMEYQLHFGAGAYTKTELAYQWTNLFFKPFSILYRVRTQYYKSEVIKIEPCNVQKVSNEAASHHNLKLHLGLGVLYKIAYELTKLSPGNYLLHHEQKLGPFAALYQESPEETSDFNLHKIYDNEFKIVEDRLKPWSPIDPSVLLPLHEEKQHMPGLFKPKLNPIKDKNGATNWKFNNAKKNNRKKAKKKAKQAQINIS